YYTFIFCLLLVLLTIPMSLLFFSSSKKQQEKELSHYKDTQIQLASTASHFIDTEFSNLIKTNWSILSDESLIKFLKNSSADLQSPDLFKRKEGIKRVQSYLNLVPMVRDIFLVSKYEDIILSSSGWFNKNSFITTYFPSHLINLDTDIINPLFPINSLSLCTQKACTNSNCKNAFYISCYVYTKPSTFDVIFVVDKLAFISYVQNLVSNNFQEVSISTQDSLLYQNLSMPFSPDYTFTSDYTSLTYSFDFFDLHIPFLMDNLLISFITIFCLCFTIAALLSFILAKPTYRIHLKIYKHLSDFDLSSFKRYLGLNNPLQILEASITHIITSKETLNNKVLSYKNMINETLLLNILLSPNSEEYLAEILDSCPWLNPNGAYSILLINIQDFSSNSYVTTCIEPILNDFAQTHSITYQSINILNSDVGFLIAYKKEDPTLVYLLEELLTRTLQNISVYTGPISHGIRGIHDSYSLARQKQQKSLYNTSSIVEGYFYPIHLELQLITNLKLANHPALFSILENIFIENDKLDLTLIQLKKLYFIIFETFDRYAHEINFDITSNRETFLKSLTHNISNVPDILLNLSQDLLTYNQHHCIEDSPTLEDEIFTYIHNNFCNSTLCIDTVSAEFQISRSYLHKILKSATNSTLPDLVNHLRIKKAMHLIELNQNTISDISKDVGYDSYSTFKRVFIKIAGVSPSDYRRLHCSN
ncbi:MAG: helix-turn-helix domain-containing protein, partial [Cellulosilyticaceae bacterium]